MARRFDRTFSRSDVDRLTKALLDARRIAYDIETDSYRELFTITAPIHWMSRDAFDRMIRVTGAVERASSDSNYSMAEYGGCLFCANRTDRGVA